MGISATAAAASRESSCLGITSSGNTDGHQTRTCLAVSLVQGDAVGVDGHRKPRPFEGASVPGALLVGAQRWPTLPGCSWRRTSDGPRIDPVEAVAAKPVPGGPQWHIIEAAPAAASKGRRSVLASSSSTCMIKAFQLEPEEPDRTLQFRSEAAIPPYRLLTPNCSSRKHLETPQRCADKRDALGPQMATSRLGKPSSRPSSAGLPAKPALPLGSSRPDDHHEGSPSTSNACLTNCRS